MNDYLIGLLGIVLLFVVAYVTTVNEERREKRIKRKYDKRMAKYDKWIEDTKRI